MVPAGIVHDHYQHASGSASAQQRLQELPEALRVEALGWHREQPTVGWADRAKDGHLLARRRVQEHRIGLFWGYPHDTA
jgi:hypothetical protein